MRHIDTIIVHHSASPPSTTLAEIKEWHLARGFSDVGYHFVIRQGTWGPEVHHARPLSKIGAHCWGSNSSSLGVCICGNYEEDEPHGEMLGFLVGFLAKLCSEYYLPSSAIRGHRELAKPGHETACPGQYMDLEALRERVRNLLNPL